jgi:DNA-binding response OmpR family regulator
MSISILWADDEIDLLKPHILFLQSKGFEVHTATNGDDALDELEKQSIDIVFLDENMPGLTGLETLTRLKAKHPSMPVIMITKSEEEEIMEDAIGSKISDYLIKPVNPNQILLSIKKNLDTKRLVSEKTTSNYQQEFRKIGMRLMDRLDENEWAELYKEIVFWEMELDKSNDESMFDILKMQKTEANNQFTKFIADNYVDWLQHPEEAPLLSHKVMEKYILPDIKDEKPLFLIMIDNLRFDQWKVIRPILENYFRVEDETSYYSILPTATHYSRNAFFAGLMPAMIEKMFPNLWKNENDEGGKNMHEPDFLENLLKRSSISSKFSYNKITNIRAGKKLVEQFSDLLKNPLNVIVYNFVDMLSHARTEMEVIRELADNDSAYRSITLSWFEHSPLLEIFKKIAENKARVVITTDHGTVQVTSAIKVVGDKNTNTNLRYKTGKNLSYNPKEVFEVKKPEDIMLPKSNVSSSYIFASGSDFFSYPNNFNYYVNYYKDTYQHGGVSLEEMIIPLIKLNPK